jgi:mannose-6-phosphate isomerase-like protein (cupin superfamily)
MRKREGGNPVLEDKADQNVPRVPPGEGRSFWLATDLHTFKVVGKDTGGAFSLEELTAYTQFGPPPHIHHREDESYYILEGEFEFTDDGRTFTAGPGSFVYLPKDRLHSHRNAGDTPASALVLVAPAGRRSSSRRRASRRRTLPPCLFLPSFRSSRGSWRRHRSTASRCHRSLGSSGRNVDLAVHTRSPQGRGLDAA